MRITLTSVASNFAQQSNNAKIKIPASPQTLHKRPRMPETRYLSLPPSEGLSNGCGALRSCMSGNWKMNSLRIDKLGPLSTGTWAPCEGELSLPAAGELAKGGCAVPFRGTGIL